MNDNQLYLFEKLDVFQASKEALKMGIQVRPKVKGLPGELMGQLERALLSIVANIAEGSGRDSAADRRRHYAIARGSATEAGAIVEIALLYGALDESEHAGLRSRLLRVVWMLTAMMRR